MKSMLKDAMIVKNQVSHVLSERKILTEAADAQGDEAENPWIVTLHYSFQVVAFYEDSLVNTWRILC